MRNDHKTDKDKSNHAPGTGSDKHHPETPSNVDVNDRKQKPGNIQENPENQNSG